MAMSIIESSQRKAPHGLSSDAVAYSGARLLSYISACRDISVCFGSSKGMFTVASLASLRTVPCDLVSK
jgi:hypothetical protein